MKSWEDVLAELDAHLDAVESAIDGRDERPLWEPPSHMPGDLPVALLPQAETLLARMHALEQAYMEKLKDIRLTMRPTATHEAVREPARLLDRRAQ